MPQIKRKASASIEGMRKAKRRLFSKARIPRNLTTLALSQQPFPPTLRKTLTYESLLGPANTSSAGSGFSCRIVCNGLYDVDYDGYFDNKQPLYFDQLCSSTGPYKYYRVLSWKTTYTVVNVTAEPINVVAFPGSSDASDIDTVTEAANMPGTKNLILTQAGGSKDIGYIAMTGNVADVFKDFGAAILGTFNSNPSSQVFGGLYIRSTTIGGSVTAHVKIKHIVDVEFTNTDALIS